MEIRTVREAVRERILESVIGSCKKVSPEAGYMVLVLDKRATRVLNASVRMYDVTQENVAVVESLEKRRQPFPQREAIYILEPTEASISRVIYDFENPSRGSDPVYKSVHIFFTRRVGADRIAWIKQCKPLVSKIKSFAEMNVDFLATESHLFHLDMDKALVQLYNASGAEREECKDRIVDSLVTVCSTLNEYPYVRYRAQSKLASDVAQKFQERSNEYVNSNQAFWWRGDGQDHGDVSLRGTLIMLDRSEDPGVPLLHTVTYQSMLNDLLDVSDDIIRFQTKPASSGETGELKRFLLTESDPLWLELRHLHMADVLNRLPAHIAEVSKSSNTAAQKMRDTNGEVSIQGMMAVARSLPEINEVAERAENHLVASSLLMDKLEELKLLECGKLEQMMVTGVDSDGRSVSSSRITAQLMDLVVDPSVGKEETTRLIGLYTLTQKHLKDNDRRKVVEAANPPLSSAEQEAIINLQLIGAADSGALEKTDQTKRSILGAVLRLAQNCDYSYGRYAPKISKLVEKFIDGTMPSAEFPYIIEPPIAASNATATSIASKSSTALSVRRHAMSKPSSAPKVKTEQGGGEFNPTGARVIVFVIGGATHYEIKALYDLMKERNREVVIGTTHILKPREFLFSLKHLKGTTSEQFNEVYAQRRKETVARHQAFDQELSGVKNPPGEGEAETKENVEPVAEVTEMKKIDEEEKTASNSVCGCL